MTAGRALHALDCDHPACRGDLGNITDNLMGDGIDDPAQLDQHIEPKPPFIDDTIYNTGSLYREVELFAFVQGQGGEGDDVMLGGDGGDSLHGGPGNDIMNGDGDSDLITRARSRPDDG